MLLMKLHKYETEKIHVLIAYINYPLSITYTVREQHQKGRRPCVSNIKKVEDLVWLHRKK